ncbi:MAG: site-2 protease family protein [Nocardioides sp.]
MSAPEPSPQRPRQPGAIRIGSVAGSDVLVTPSWFLVAAVITVSMAPVVESFEPGLGALRYLAAFLFAVVIYGSVLLHEAAHAIVAKRLGYPVGDITFHFLGGATEVEAEAVRPRDEFLIAVVGPLTSLVVAAAAALAWWAGPDGLVLLAVEGLLWANGVVGVLNMVPGLPLDGGRVMKAAVWGATKNMHRGTLVAGWIGRIAAVGAVAWPFAAGLVTGNEPSLFDVLFGFLIGMFLWQGATAAIVSARMRQRLPQLVARNLARRTLAVPADLSIAEAVRRAQEAQAGSIITVTATGQPIGVVSEPALRATQDDRRPWMPISAVTRDLTAGLSLPATIHGEELIRAIGQTPATEYLLIEEDGSVYGVLSTTDVDAAFQSTGR